MILCRSPKSPEKSIKNPYFGVQGHPRSLTSIQILPADKGRATVIIDKTEYETKVKDMLEDEKT